MALQKLATSSANQLERIHAIWTLEGLNAADPSFYRELMKDRLPAGQRDRPKKGFGLPIRRWLRQDSGYVRQAMSTLTDAGILRAPVDHGFDRIWLLLVLARWLELNR